MVFIFFDRLHSVYTEKMVDGITCSLFLPSILTSRPGNFNFFGVSLLEWYIYVCDLENDQKF